MTNPLLLTRATAEIRKLTEAGRALIRAVSLGDILRLTVDRAADLLSVDRVVLLLADERGLLSAAAACGIDESASSGLQSIQPEDTRQRLEGALAVAAGRLLAVPLAVEDRVAGVLAAVATDRADIAASQEWLLAALADQAAAAIEHRRLREPEPHPGQRVVFAVESTGIGIWEYVPATGRLSWDARCRALLNAGPDLPDRYQSFLASVHPGDRPQLEDQIQRALEGSTDCFRVDCRPAPGGGEERWLMFAGRGLFDHRAEPVGVVGTVIEVTDRKRTEEDLRAEAERFRRLSVEHEVSIRSRDQFLMTLAHDLRTPLTAIGGWVRLLQSAKLSPEQAARALDVIGRNVKTQTRIVDDLLDLSRMATGELRVQPIWCDAATVIDSAIDAIRPAAEAKDIRIDTVVGPDAAGMFADPQRVQQILWHVIGNAVKYTGRCGQVTVTCARVAGELEIAVADNGEGIAPHLLPVVFDRLVHGDGPGGEDGRRGLGLAIVRHLMTLHGGSARVHSDGKGLGTTLTLRLPLPARAEAAIDGQATVQRPA